MDVRCGCDGVPQYRSSSALVHPDYYAEKDVVGMVAVQDAG